MVAGAAVISWGRRGQCEHAPRGAKGGRNGPWAPELLPRWRPTKSWGALMNGKPQHDMTLREPSPRGVQARPWGRQGAVRGREHPEGPGGGLLLCAKRVLRLSAILSDTTDGQSRRSTPSGRADSSGVQRVEFTELLMSTYCMCVVTLGTTMLSEQKPPGREEATDPSPGRQSGSGQVLAEQGEGGPGEPPTSSLGRSPVLGTFSRWERQRGG